MGYECIIILVFLISYRNLSNRNKRNQSSVESSDSLYSFKSWESYHQFEGPKINFNGIQPKFIEWLAIDLLERIKQIEIWIDAIKSKAFDYTVQNNWMKSKSFL